MKLFVGLGNIGNEFVNTYHNMGFDCIELFAKKLGLKIEKKSKNCLFCKTKDFILAKPTTYMNLSGNAVLELMQKYKIKNEDIFVFYDDFDLPIGTFRFRTSGKAGSHNGAKHITSMIGENWNRFRIGIKPDKDVDLLNYVLSKVNEESRAKLDVAIDKAVEEAKELV